MIIIINITVNKKNFTNLNSLSSLDLKINKHTIKAIKGMYMGI